jgi:hypothetical protein
MFFSNVNPKYELWTPDRGTIMTGEDSYGISEISKKNIKGKGFKGIQKETKTGINRCKLCHRSWNKVDGKVEYLQYAYMDHGAYNTCPECKNKDAKK